MKKKAYVVFDTTGRAMGWTRSKKVLYGLMQQRGILDHAKIPLKEIKPYFGELSYEEYEYVKNGYFDLLIASEAEYTMYCESFGYSNHLEELERTLLLMQTYKYLRNKEMNFTFRVVQKTLHDLIRKYNHLIYGEYVEGISEEELDLFNPADYINDEVLLAEFLGVEL